MARAFTSKLYLLRILILYKIPQTRYQIRSAFKSAAISAQHSNTIYTRARSMQPPRRSSPAKSCAIEKWTRIAARQRGRRRGSLKRAHCRGGRAKVKSRSIGSRAIVIDLSRLARDPRALPDTTARRTKGVRADSGRGEIERCATAIGRPT